MVLVFVPGMSGYSLSGVFTEPILQLITGVYVFGNWKYLKDPENKLSEFKGKTFMIISAIVALAFAIIPATSIFPYAFLPNEINKESNNSEYILSYRIKEDVIRCRAIKTLRWLPFVEKELGRGEFSSNFKRFMVQEQETPAEAILTDFIEKERYK